MGNHLSSVSETARYPQRSGRSREILSARFVSPLPFSPSSASWLLLGRREVSLQLVFSYLDDCCLAGEQTAVANAFSHLATAAAAIGLEFPLDKCERIRPPDSPRN
jgi:hypothetical protein